MIGVANSVPTQTLGNFHVTESQLFTNVPAKYIIDRIENSVPTTRESLDIRSSKVKTTLKKKTSFGTNSFSEETEQTYRTESTQLKDFEIQTHSVHPDAEALKLSDVNNKFVEEDQVKYKKELENVASKPVSEDDTQNDHFLLHKTSDRSESHRSRNSDEYDSFLILESDS